MKLTFNQIVNSMKNTYTEKCGYTIGKNSSEEKAIEAFASELYNISCYGDFILKQAFVRTATGEYLDSHGELRGCVRKAPEKAIGVLKFGISLPSVEDIIIEAGTVCSIRDYPLIQFETLEQGIIKAGECSVEIRAQAVECGEKYNVGANTVTVMVNAPIGVEFVNNQNEFYGGYNGETDGAYRRRIIETYKLPSFEMSRKTIENRVKQIECVTDCILYDTDTAGSINVMVSTKNDLLDDDVKKQVEYCVGFAELIGAAVNVTLAEPKAVNLTAELLYTADKALSEITQTAYNKIHDFFAERAIGNSMSVSSLTNEMLKIDGVEEFNLYSDSILAGYIFCPQDAYVKLGELEVNCYAK